MSGGKILIGLGILTILIGLWWEFSGKGFPLGKLPGDIHIKKENFSFYFPITSSIVISIILGLILKLLKK